MSDRQAAAEVLDRFGVEGRAALVTGAGRGIGAACAEALAGAGADVLITARSEDQLEAVAARVAALGRRCVVAPADANDTAALRALPDQAMAEFGRLDIVVNNVGGSMPKAFLDTSEASFERAFHFNVTTAFALTQAATPHLLESGSGSVVNIASLIGRVADRGYAAYGTAKAAMVHLTRLLAKDLAPRVRVNAIGVGSVATSALEVVTADEGLRAQMEEATPMRRLGEPEDIALACLYLASPAASFVTGAVLSVDGGLDGSNLSLGLPDLEAPLS